MFEILLSLSLTTDHRLWIGLRFGDFPFHGSKMLIEWSQTGSLEEAWHFYFGPPLKSRNAQTVLSLIRQDWQSISHSWKVVSLRFCAASPHSNLWTLFLFNEINKGLKKRFRCTQVLFTTSAPICLRLCGWFLLDHLPEHLTFHQTHPSAALTCWTANGHLSFHASVCCSQVLHREGRRRWWCLEYCQELGLWLWLADLFIWKKCCALLLCVTGNWD